MAPEAGNAVIPPTPPPRPQPIRTPPLPPGVVSVVDTPVGRTPTPPTVAPAAAAAAAAAAAEAALFSSLRPALTLRRRMMTTMVPRMSRIKEPTTVIKTILLTGGHWWK